MRPNQVWSSDITYIPTRFGFLYLTAIDDWYSRRILACRLSKTMDVAFCADALEEALEKFGTPEVFNTDRVRNSLPTPLPGCWRQRALP